MTVTAVAGGGASVAVRLSGSGRIASTGTGAVTLTADRVDTTDGGILFADGGTYQVEIGGPAPGNAPTEYDRLNVTGGVTIEPTAALRPVLVGGFTPVLGQRYVIVDNDGTDPVAGTFAGLGEGATFTLGGVPFVITYTGGDGNDVVLIASHPSLLAVMVGDQLRVINPVTGSVRQLVPYPGFDGGATVATADLNGDGVPDIVTGAGPGGGPHVKVFDGVSLAVLASFFAYDPGFRDGVSVAVAAGRIVTAAGPGGGPHVKVFDATGAVEYASFFAFDPAFRGGVSVAAGDLTGDGVPDVVVGAGVGGAPHVKAIDGRFLGQVLPDGQIADAALLASFFAYDPEFAGGVFVAATRGRIVVGAGPGGGPHVKVFDGTGAVESASFFAYDPAFRGGVDVAVGDLTGDGMPDLVTGAGPGGGPYVKVFDGTGAVEYASFFAGDPAFTGGVFV